MDAWACGVIMYTLLIGRPPFWHRKQMMLIRQIMRGEYTMVGPDWAEVTVETKELVSLDLLEWKWLPSSTLVAFAKVVESR